MMKFEFENIDELINRLEMTGNNVEQGKQQALTASANLLQEETKKIAPVSTGNLRGNINVSDVEDDEISVYVDQQGSAYYGHFLEYGTSKMRAQPFMYPAFHKNRSRIERRMADALRERLGLM